jgi:translocation and assembly module TamB
MMFGHPASTASQSEGSALAGAAASIGLSGGELLARKIGVRFGIENIRVENTGSTETTSLVLGTYLTPRMYVQYGVGLFEPINTLTVRYELNKRWRVEAESGEAQGSDLLYSIER